MTYIYDILLNFNQRLIEFFEWDDSDKINYVKKIGLFKVESQVINDILNCDIVFDDDFLNEIPDYEEKGVKQGNKMCLFTDSFIVIGVLFEDNSPVLFSRLLIDEEGEVLDISDSLEISNINYKVLGIKKKCIDNLTRREEKIKDKIKDEIEVLYKLGDIEKLSYLYYEYTSKEIRNLKQIYNFFINSLNFFNEKHFMIYEILLLSNVNSSKK